MSSSYNANIQVSLAQTHIVAKDQDKAKKNHRKQQDDLAKSPAQEAVDDERVRALSHDETVDNDSVEHEELQRRKANLLKKEQKKESAVIVRDDSKGKKINIKC